MPSVRVDRAERIHLGARPIEVRPDGYRVYRGIATYGDVVLDYPDLDPPRAEFVPAAEALSPEAVASALGSVFTITHPEDLLTSEDALEHLVGAVIRAVPDLAADPPELEVDVIVWDAGAQEAVESGGMSELSFGYRCEEDATPGSHRGRAYQVVQRRRRYNHLAGVEFARTRTHDGRAARLDEQGPRHAVRLDALSTHAAQVLAAWAAVGCPEDHPGAQVLKLHALAEASEGPTYPPTAAPGTGPTRQTTMDDETQTPATATNTDAADKGKPRLDALSPEDAEILKTMSPEAQAIVAAAVGGGMASGEASGPAAPGAPAGGAGMADVVAMLQQVLAKLNAGGGDAAPMADAPADPAVMADKKDAKPMPDKTTAPSVTVKVDAASVLALVEKAVPELAAKSARATFDAAAKFVGIVRKDGHADVDTPDEAAAVMFKTIKAHLPLLLPAATDHLKANRLDGLTVLYQQAEVVRRDGLLRAQMDAVGAVFRADAEALEAGSPAPLFTSPPPRGAGRQH